MSPSAAQAKTVHDQWKGTDKDAFMFNMFKEMFATHPEWRAKFKKLSGDPTPADAAWKAQFDITRDTLHKAIQLADGDMATLKTTLHDLAKKHVGFGVGQTEFQKFKPVLGAVVSKSVAGADMAAWQALIDYICDNLV